MPVNAVNCYSPSVVDEITPRSSSGKKLRCSYEKFYISSDTNNGNELINIKLL